MDLGDRLFNLSLHFQESMWNDLKKISLFKNLISSIFKNENNTFKRENKYQLSQPNFLDNFHDMRYFSESKYQNIYHAMHDPEDVRFEIYQEALRFDIDQMK